MGNELMSSRPTSWLRGIGATCNGVAIAAVLPLLLLAPLASSANAQGRVAWTQTAPHFGDASTRYLYEASYAGGEFRQVLNVECDGVVSPFACSGSATSALRPVRVRAVDIIDTVRYESAATSSAEEQIQPPNGPVTFCGAQAPPAGDSHTVSVDGGPEQPVTLAPPAAACPAGSTHSFTLPASLFPIGNHTVRVTSINAFGATAGPSYNVTVGIAPGQFTVTAVIPPAGE